MPESSPHSRYVAIDLARGIALLGVALVNVHAFAATWSALYGLDMAGSMLDVLAEGVNAMLFTHRSYPVLSFLFGAGLALQWAHLPVDTRRPKELRGRLWALLAMGVAHGLLLWPGDVLATYAVVGLLIVTLLKFDPRVTLGWVVIVYALTTALYVSIGLAMYASGGEPYPAIETTASFAELSVREALARHPGEYAERGLAQLLVPDFWAHALFGMWAARSGALQRFLAAPFERAWICLVGALLVVAGSATELIASEFGGWNALTYVDTGYGLMTLALLPASLGGLWFWLTVAACWSRSGSVSGGVAGLAGLVLAAGRAPLTQFIGQSIVFAVIFNKSLVGWHGELSRAVYSLIALTSYLLLCGFIRAWLASGHAHGPLEIVWRRLSRAR
jgi:uncharacterized protein